MKSQFTPAVQEKMQHPPSDLHTQQESLVIIIARELFNSREVLLHVHQIHPGHLLEDVAHATGVQTLYSVDKKMKTSFASVVSTSANGHIG